MTARPTARAGVVRSPFPSGAGFRGPCAAVARRAGWLLAALLGLFVASSATAAEVIPAAPRDHFNDYAGVVAPATARELNVRLAQAERDTSNQLVVAIYPRMPSDSSIEDYTVRVAQAWGVGQQDRKNGAVLFIFVQDRALYIQVGYGLEGVLPDAICKRIVADEITPRFRAGDYSGGVAAGVEAMLAATRGEYRGSGHTVREGRRGGDLSGPGLIALIVVLVVGSLFARRREVVYHRGGRRSMWFGGGPGPWGGGGGNWGGGGGGGGGTFSGGGGGFGGGGAGGRW